MFRSIIACLIPLALATATCHAGWLLQSSHTDTSATPNCCGSVSIFSANYSGVGNPQWLGARFSVIRNAHVSAIGGVIEQLDGPGEIFGTIVRLDGPNGLPLGTPFVGTELKYITVLRPLVSGSSSVWLGGTFQASRSWSHSRDGSHRCAFMHQGRNSGNHQPGQPRPVDAASEVARQSPRVAMYFHALQMPVPVS